MWGMANSAAYYSAPGNFPQLHAIKSIKYNDAGILAQWFEIVLLLLFLRYATMVGILIGVMTPSAWPCNTLV